MTNRSTILIVDDEPRMLEVLEVALQAAGYRTVTAADAGAAWPVGSSDTGGLDAQPINPVQGAIRESANAWAVNLETAMGSS